MKTIKNGKFYSIRCFEREDYLKNFDELNEFMTRIFSSHEYGNSSYDYQEAIEEINEKNQDFFAEEFLIPRLYVLFDEENRAPVSFALYSHDDERDDWHLEFIATHEDYKQMGFAEAILKASAKDLMTTEYPRISSVVAKSNGPSLALHDAVGSAEGIKLFSEPIEGNRISFLFDLKNMNKENASKDVDETVF